MDLFTCSMFVVRVTSAIVFFFFFSCAMLARWVLCVGAGLRPSYTALRRAVALVSYVLLLASLPSAAPPTHTGAELTRLTPPQRTREIVRRARAPRRAPPGAPRRTKTLQNTTVRDQFPRGLRGGSELGAMQRPGRRNHSADATSTRGNSSPPATATLRPCGCREAHAVHASG